MGGMGFAVDGFSAGCGFLVELLCYIACAMEKGYIQVEVLWCYGCLFWLSYSLLEKQHFFCFSFRVGRRMGFPQIQRTPFDDGGSYVTMHAGTCYDSDEVSEEPTFYLHGCGTVSLDRSIGASALSHF